MEERHRTLLLRNFIALERDLDPSALVSHLLQFEILSPDEWEAIENKGIRRNCARELLLTLMRKGPDAYGVFLEALNKTHKHLHDLLVKSASEPTESDALEGMFDSSLK